MKKLVKRLWWYVFRSSKSGQYITEEEAEASPDTSERERVERD